MPGIARACVICGRRVEGGASKCADHAGQHYRNPVACKVCGRLSAKTHCPDHDPLLGSKPEAERLARQPWRRGYRDPNYHRERQAVLKRAGGRCEACGRAGRLEVDHLIPLSTARDLEEVRALNRRQNLRALCVACHRMKTLRRGS